MQLLTQDHNHNDLQQLNRARGLRAEGSLRIQHSSEQGPTAQRKRKQQNGENPFSLFSEGTS